MMPEMDGFELCRRVKTDERLHTIPFVFYTATYIEQKDEKLAMALGASRFLIKPMEPEEFFSTISGVIEEHRAGHLPVPDQLLAEMTELDRMQLEALARKLDKKVRELEEEREGASEKQIAASSNTTGLGGYLSGHRPSNNNTRRTTQYPLGKQSYGKSSRGRFRRRADRQEML